MFFFKKEVLVNNLKLNKFFDFSFIDNVDDYDQNIKNIKGGFFFALSIMVILLFSSIFFFGWFNFFVYKINLSMIYMYMFFEIIVATIYQNRYPKIARSLLLCLNFFYLVLLTLLNYKYVLLCKYSDVVILHEVLNCFFFNIVLDYDGLSLLLINLTFILNLVCVLFLFSEPKRNSLTFLLKITVFFLLLSFSTFNLLVFYISFESILIPVFLMIGLGGSGDRKMTAAYRLMFYTLFGSIFFLGLLLYIFFIYRTFDLIELLLIVKFEPAVFQKIAWFCMFIALAVKIPLYPFHTWLPEAHAEAPTVGSILLAGILLKLGPYGFIRFANVLFPLGFEYFKPLVYLMCLLSIYYTAIIALRQLDIKKVVAYSSISHMAFAVLGIWSQTVEGVTGGILLLVAHGFVSGCMFLIVGYIYQRYKTRIILYYGGLAQINPLICLFFFIAILGNISFPITLNFVAELLILVSLMELNSYILVLVCFSSVFILAFNLFLFNRFFFGRFSNFYEEFVPDLFYREVIFSIMLLFPVYFFGITSVCMTDFFITSVYFFIFESTTLNNYYVNYYFADTYILGPLDSNFFVKDSDFLNKLVESTVKAEDVSLSSEVLEEEGMCIIKEINTAFLVDNSKSLLNESYTKQIDDLILVKMEQPFISEVSIKKS